MRCLFVRTTAVAASIALSTLAASAASPVGPQDALFANQATQAGMTEVKLAALALDTSKNPAVISFAQQMSADHRKANMQLMSIVQEKGLTSPSDVGPRNRAMMSMLQDASGSAFDTAYLKSQLPAHRKVLALFKKEAATGTDREFVAFAKPTIPVIVSHITMDRHDSAKIGMGMRGSMPLK